MSLTSKWPKLARASSAWQGWILYQEVWRDHCLEPWRYSQRCNGDTRMLGRPTLLAICWRYQLALCETSQKVKVPGLAAVWRTEGAGFFKASGSQNDGTTNPRGQAWSHRVSRFPFLWILVLFDQLILAIIPFLHPALGWKHLLYVTVYWRYIIWYIRWEFDFREANGWKRALSLRWSCTSALKQSIFALWEDRESLQGAGVQCYRSWCIWVSSRVFRGCTWDASLSVQPIQCLWARPWVLWPWDGVFRGLKWWRKPSCWCVAYHDCGSKTG